ncbi:MAG TPA: antibiotic biosynthesis monooxygenase [Planctomycetota bacterium]
MNEVRLTAHFAIHPGQLEVFKTHAETCLRIVQEQDTGTIQYDWFLSDDGTRCVVQETYRDSAAVLEHFEHVGATIAEIVRCADPAIELFGSLSPALVAAIADLPHTIYGSLQSL